MVTADILLDCEVSDQQHNQILSHTWSDMFLKHYISLNAVVDIQATFLSTASKLDLIKEIRKLCLHCDPNLPKWLLNNQCVQAHQHSNVICAQKKKNALAQRLQNNYDCIKNDLKSPNSI